MRTLTRREAREFYDRFGARQDRQGFYEDRATADLVAHADFGRAAAVVELGCGTGRFAEGLLEHHLPADATYLGIDISATMTALAGRRLQRFGRRAEVVQSDGSLRVDRPSASCDRFVSNYLFDLLSENDILTAVAEAKRLLRPGGLLCASGLGDGCSPLSKLVAAVWTRVHALRPRWVGGCRPLDLLDYLPAEAWRVEHQRRLAAWGIPSQVVIAVSVRPSPALAR